MTRPGRAETVVESRWFLLAVVVATAFAFQGRRGLYDTTEGRYAECAREMVETGRWLEPQLDGHPHWTKPPLAYWGVAAGIRVAGNSAWGARLGNAVALVLTALIVAGIGATLWDRRTGITAGIVHATSPLPVIGAFALSADTVLTLWMTLAMLAYVRACATSGAARRRFLVLGFWGCVALGFLTKGPPALLVILPAVVWNWLRAHPIRLLDPIGVSLSLLLGLSWYLLMCARHTELYSFFLGEEVLGRISGHVGGHSAHHPEWYKPLTLYGAALGGGALPWLAVAHRGVIRERLWRPVLLARRLAAGGPASLLLVWLLLPLLVFSLVRSRLPLYVLPLSVPVSLGLARLLVRHGSRRLTFWAAVAFATILIAVKGGSSLRDIGRDSSRTLALCRQVPDLEATTVYTYRDLGRFGLQFYLDGAVRRTTPEAGVLESLHYEALHCVLAAHRQGDGRTALAIVCENKYSAELEAAIQAAGENPRTWRNKHRTLFLLP